MRRANSCADTVDDDMLCFLRKRAGWESSVTSTPASAAGSSGWSLRGSGGHKTLDGDPSWNQLFRVGSRKIRFSGSRLADTPLHRKKLLSDSRDIAETFLDKYNIEHRKGRRAPRGDTLPHLKQIAQDWIDTHGTASGGTGG